MKIYLWICFMLWQRNTHTHRQEREGPTSRTGRGNNNNTQLFTKKKSRPSSCLGKRPWEHSSGRRWVADESASPCWAVMVSQKPEVAAAPRTPKGRCLAGCSAHRPDAFAQVISEEDETGPLVSVTATASRRRDCSLVVSDRACAQTAAWLDRAARASGPRVSLEAKHCLA